MSFYTQGAGKKIKENNVYMKIDYKAFVIIHVVKHVCIFIVQ